MTMSTTIMLKDSSYLLQKIEFIPLLMEILDSSMLILVMELSEIRMISLILMIFSVLIRVNKQRLLLLVMAVKRLMELLILLSMVLKVL